MAPRTVKPVESGIGKYREVRGLRRLLSTSRARIFGSVAVLAVALAAFVGGQATQGRASTPPRSGAKRAVAPGARRNTRVNIYGDSLTVQAAPYLNAIGKVYGLTVKVRAFSGTAPCDFLPLLESDLRKRKPDLVLFAFSGNSIATCMLDGSGHPLVGDAVLAKYAADTDTAIAETTRAHVPFVLASPPAPFAKAATWKQFDDLYRSVAASHPGVNYVDAGQDIAPGGEFSATQQCMPFEVNLPQARTACHGPDADIAVRGPDGAHFCGNATLTTANPCSAYSSGAMRYAINLTDAARLTLDYLEHAAVTQTSPQRS